MSRDLTRWAARVAIGVVFALLLAWIALGWVHSNGIRSEFLVPLAPDRTTALTVEDTVAGRIVLTRSEASTREGLWGLEGEDAYAQVSTIVRLDDTTVERGVRSLEGSFEPGDQARIDLNAYTSDPLTSHRIGFDDVVIPSEIGPHVGWFIDGRRSTWILFVHGRGTDQLPESLRIIPSFVEQGFPVMVMSYRNDVGGTPSESGLRTWGLEEWRDVEAAIELGLRKGARDFVIMGSGFGASVVSMYLHESDTIGSVRGVIFDSPVVDLETSVRQWSDGESTPRLVGWLGRRLATVRFGIEWGELDQIERAAAFDVPILIVYGGEDPVTPPDAIAEFADRLGPLAEVHRFEQAAHTDLWNIDQNRYESVLADWLTQLIGPE